MFVSHDVQEKEFEKVTLPVRFVYHIRLTNVRHFLGK